MKAVVCKELGPPEGLAVEDVPAPDLGPRDARVAVRAAGVTFPDLLIIQGLYQAKVTPPFVPGTEAVGEVIELGSEVTGVEPGARVIAAVPYGAFAEEIVADAGSLMPIPDSMDFASAAAFGSGYTTGYHALVQRGRLREGETLLVHAAAGGVGLATVQIGQALGARVIGTVGDDEKLQIVQENGAEAAINYERESLRDAVKELTAGRGADVIFDPVGGDVFDESLRCIAWNGRILIVGFASGRIPQAPANLILLKGCSVVGVYTGAFVARQPEQHRENVAQLLRWFDEGRLRPRVWRTLPLQRAAEALIALRDRQVVGRVVLTTGDSSR